MVFPKFLGNVAYKFDPMGVVESKFGLLKVKLRHRGKVLERTTDGKSANSSQIVSQHFDRESDRLVVKWCTAQNVQTIWCSFSFKSAFAQTAQHDVPNFVENLRTNTAWRRFWSEPATNMSIPERITQLNEPDVELEPVYKSGRHVAERNTYVWTPVGRILLDVNDVCPEPGR